MAYSPHQGDSIDHKFAEVRTNQYSGVIVCVCEGPSPHTHVFAPQSGSLKTRWASNWSRGVEVTKRKLGGDVQKYFVLNRFFTPFREPHSMPNVALEYEFLKIEIENSNR